MSANVELRELPQSTPQLSQSDANSTNEPATVGETLVQQQVDDVPDGQYGWVVLGACAVMSFWYGGSTYSWGILQAQLVSDGLGAASTLSWVGSLCCAGQAIFGIFNARLIRIVGARNMGFLAALFLGGGEILSGFCVNNLPGLFIAQGLIVGLGVSMALTVCFSLPGQYFRKRLGVATGIAYMGAGIGGALLSVGLEALLSRFGTAWTFRIIGLLAVVTMSAASTVIKERGQVKPRKFVDWRLFKNPKFLLVLIASSIGTFPMFVPPFFLPLYGATLGLTAAQSAGLVAGFNLASAFGRVTFGLLADRAGPLNSLLLALAIGSLTFLTLWPFSTSLPPLIVFATGNGISNGAFFALQPVVTGSVFGSQGMATVFGMIVTGWAGGYLLGSPIAGYILQASGGSFAVNVEVFRPAMYYAGSLSVASMGLVGLLRFSIDKRILAKV